MSNWQHTLRNPIQAQGVGLHSGDLVRLTLRPAPENHGIQFCRVDLSNRPIVPATVEAVADTRLATTLRWGDATIGTVEHLMAALAGVGVDNALIEVDAAELPIMDGSAAPWVFLIEAAGLAVQHEPRRFLRILEPVVHVTADVSALLKPHDGFQLQYTLSYDHPVLRAHSNCVAVEFSATSFRRELARARTFGVLEDFDSLKARNLVRGGSLDNALVVDGEGILNEHGLRLRDEFARHKMVDAVGDLYLLGYPLLGTFIGFKSGHGTNHELLKRLLANEQAWRIESFPNSADLPGGYGQTSFAETA